MVPTEARSGTHLCGWRCRSMGCRMPYIVTGGASMSEALFSMTSLVLEVQSLSDILKKNGIMVLGSEDLFIMDMFQENSANG